MRPPQVTFAGSAASAGQFPKDGLPEVALLGRSNVGKSSLLNSLAGTRGLARVSAAPGRTRLVNFFRVGDRLYLADLPGYGYAKVPEAVRKDWERLVTSYLLDRAPLALCLFLVDARHEAMAADEVLQAWLDHHALPYVLVATKADKLGRGELQRRMAALRRTVGRSAAEVIAVSARDGTGVDALWRAVWSAVAPDGRGAAGAARGER